MALIRLQKWMSQLGLASRRQAETWIREGRVAVDGLVINELGFKVDPEMALIAVDGKTISIKKPPLVYWLLNKPDKVLTSRRAEENKRTIYDLPSLKNLAFLVSPVGRLDYRTEGLLLLSNDGELVNRLMHPKYKLPRHYHVLVSGKLTREESNAIKAGVPLTDGISKKCLLKYGHGFNLGQSRGSWYHITVFEGRNRLVRRLFEHFGLKVIRLVRFGFGDLRLSDKVAPGEYRQLTSLEIRKLKESTSALD